MKTLIIGMTYLDELTSRWDTEASWKIVLILVCLPLIIPVAFLLGILIQLERRILSS